MSIYKSFLTIGSMGGVNLDSLLKSGYELSDCEFSFKQGIDDKGEASTEVYAGTIIMNLPMLPPDSIIKWAMESRTRYDGMIVLLDHFDNPNEKIYFENAACVNFNFEFNDIGESYPSTSITIRAERLVLGHSGIDFDNFWTK